MLATTPNTLNQRNQPSPGKAKGGVKVKAEPGRRSDKGGQKAGKELNPKGANAGTEVPEDRAKARPRRKDDAEQERPAKSKAGSQAQRSAG